MSHVYNKLNGINDGGQFRRIYKGIDAAEL